MWLLFPVPEDQFVLTENSQRILLSLENSKTINRTSHVILQSCSRETCENFEFPVLHQVFSEQTLMYEIYDKDSQGRHQFAQFAFNHLGLTPVDSGDTEVSTVDVKP